MIGKSWSPLWLANCGPQLLSLSWKIVVPAMIEKMWSPLRLTNFGPQLLSPSWQMVAPVMINCGPKISEKTLKENLRKQHLKKNYMKTNKIAFWKIPVTVFWHWKMTWSLGLKDLKQRKKTDFTLSWFCWTFGDHQS